MEKRRAIELLKLAVPIKALTQQEYSDFVEAVNMGMDALEAQLSRENATSDTINRQAAIDALDTAIEHYDGIAEECRKKADIERNDYMDMRDDAYEARQLAQWLNELKYLREKIEQLTIQPEPKKGHWIWVAGDLECSKCHTRYLDLYPDYDNSVACPHCGYKMEVEHDSDLHAE